MKTIKNDLNYVVIYFILLFALSIGANAQTASIYRAKNSNISVSYYADIRNGTIGSEPTNNKPALNYTTRATLRSGHVETALFYEQFKRINFQAYGLNVNYVNEINWLTISVGVEALGINRESNGVYLAYGFNGEFRVKLTERLLIGLQSNLRRRTDLAEYNQGKGKFLFGFIR